MICSDKLAKKLGFENKNDLQQYFELFPEAHSKIKATYKSEYEKFYATFTSQALQTVNIYLNQKSWTTQEFCTSNKEMKAEHKLKWEILIDQKPYLKPVESDQMSVIENLTNKINFK